jgi:hypothetical protein
MRSVTELSAMERAKVKMLPLANRANDLGPAATVCCNACRTCMTTNIIGVGIAALGGIGLGARRLARRLYAKPS